MTRTASQKPNFEPARATSTITLQLDRRYSGLPPSVGPWRRFVSGALGSTVAADGFSAPYRYAMASGTGLYGFLALLVSFRLARKYVRPVWSFVATLAIWWASSLPVYMYFNPSWSHAHSAFVVCACFFGIGMPRERAGALAQWLLLGVIVGLMLDVYYANLMVLSVLAGRGRVAVRKFSALGASSPSFRSF